MLKHLYSRDKCFLSNFTFPGAEDDWQWVQSSQHREWAASSLPQPKRFPLEASLGEVAAAGLVCIAQALQAINWSLNCAWNWNFLSTKTAISECSQVAFWSGREKMEFLKSMPTPLGGVRPLMAIWQSPWYGPASNSAHTTGTTQVPASAGQASQRAWSLNWEHLKHSG